MGRYIFGAASITFIFLFYILYIFYILFYSINFQVRIKSAINKQHLCVYVCACVCTQKLILYKINFQVRTRAAINKVCMDIFRTDPILFYNFYSSL